jgi:hypothetical protein
MKYFNYQDRCIIAEDQEFIEEYLNETRNKPNLPLSEEHLDKITHWGKQNPVR